MTSLEFKVNESIDAIYFGFMNYIGQHDGEFKFVKKEHSGRIIFTMKDCLKKFVFESRIDKSGMFKDNIIAMVYPYGCMKYSTKLPYNGYTDIEKELIPRLFNEGVEHMKKACLFY